MTTNRIAIIHLVMRSTPFCRPRLQIAKPIAIAASIHPISSLGFASIALNTFAATSLPPPVNVPAAILGMYASIQPATVV